MKTNLTILVTLFVIHSACEKDESVKPIDSDNLLIGYWAERLLTEDNQMTLTRVSKLPEKDYAIQFDYADKFIERKYPAWLSSLPVDLENFNGTWTKDGERIRITVGEWMGGTSHHVWKIIEVNEKHLTVELL